MLSRLIPLCILLLGSLATAFGQDPKPECPRIELFGPPGILKPGDKFSYTVKVGKDSLSHLKYHWKLSEGEVVSGQGTSAIEIAWPQQDMLTVTVEISGLPVNCTAIASDHLEYLPAPVSKLIDEFGKRPKADIETRFRKFFAELGNNTRDHGYIINYGTDKEIAARERLFMQNIAFRNFDRSRITMIRGGAHESGTVYTKLYRVPPGAENPAP
ncbi:MAG: hypothetical protein AB7Q37_04210 [Pyrinomonadaceae bacterium]